MSMNNLEEFGRCVLNASACEVNEQVPEPVLDSFGGPSEGDPATDFIFQVLSSARRLGLLEDEPPNPRTDMIQVRIPKEFL